MDRARAAPEGEMAEATPAEREEAQRAAESNTVLAAAINVVSQQARASAYIGGPDGTDVPVNYIDSWIEEKLISNQSMSEAYRTFLTEIRKVYQNFDAEINNDLGTHIPFRARPEVQNAVKYIATKNAMDSGYWTESIRNHSVLKWRIPTRYWDW